MRYEYDMIVIGGGASGLTASGIAANLGAKTLLIESGRLGGDCTWTGCVPSKTLLSASQTAQSLREAHRVGLTDQEPQIDFEQLMNHVRKTRREVYEDADHPDIFRNMGVEVAEGKARFVDDHKIQIDQIDSGSRRVSGRFIIIATGGTVRVPPVPGLDQVTYLTSESLFEIQQLPRQLVVIGAGPIGIEMSQAFQRLGSDVTVVDRESRILPNDDPELTGLLKGRLEQEGIDFCLNAAVQQVTQKEHNSIAIQMKHDGESRELTGDRLLVATGKQPRLDSLELENAGVRYTRTGITVDDRCRTSQSHIYGCGDVTGRYQFTHMSEHMAKVAVTNALLKFPKKIDADHVPWCTYVEPELAQLGQRKRDLEDSCTDFNTYRFPFDKVDRAITEGDPLGLIKVHARKNSGKILGVSMLGAHAGDLIGEYALAMRNGVGLRQIADTIHPYPTYGLANRRAADQWYVQNQSEWMIRLLQKLFGYRGTVPDLSDPDRIM